MERTTSLYERIKMDKELFYLWSRLSPQTQKELQEVDAGIRVPDLLNDTVFKTIFDPDENGEQLSRFISAILGKKVKVLHSLKNEGRHHSMYSKGIVMDLVVQFENGSIGNVEIQRYGIRFPSKRAACYSADLVTRQYAVEKGEPKSEVDFERIQPVYTIIIFENSPMEFKDSGKYHHHFQQTSNTGVEQELLQYYDYICLDIFKKQKPHVAGELERWLNFLTIDQVEDMEEFLAKNSSFQAVFSRVILITKDREELMELMTDFFEKEDIIASLNKTNQSKVERLEKELEEQRRENEEQKKLICQLRKQLEKEKYPNPFILERADPYVMKGSDGYYYFTASYPMKSDEDPEGYDRVILRRGKSIQELSQAEEITIWEADESTASHRFIWAPEIHEINGKWYIFYAGSYSTENRWAFDCHVLQCEGDDPYTGKWVEKGKFGKLPEDTFSFTGFSLDMTYFEAAGHSYVIWAQHNEDKISCLYLGEVNPEEPWHLISLPMLLTKPEYDWEKIRYAVNEGPAVIKHEGKIFVCFSASGTGPEYCVGVLEAEEDSDLFSVASWEKKPHPVLTSEDLQDEYGPGHNSFVKDENGEDWIVYHARSKECYEGKCGYADNDPLYDPCRHARIRKVRWDEGGLGIDCE